LVEDEHGGMSIACLAPGPVSMELAGIVEKNNMWLGNRIPDTKKGLRRTTATP
jgi:hypothetical protein